MNHFFDLEAHEMLRQAAVLEACDGLYDPTQVAADEAEARVLLYSGLSPEQERVRVMLVEAGVLDA